MGEEMQSPKLFWSPVGSNDWQELGEPIKTLTFRTDEAKADSEPYKPFTFSATVIIKGKKAQEKLRRLFKPDKHRLPRKLKKGAKYLQGCYNVTDILFYVNRIDRNGYITKPRTKWEKKAAFRLERAFIKDMVHRCRSNMKEERVYEPTINIAERIRQIYGKKSN